MGKNDFIKRNNVPINSDFNDFIIPGRYSLNGDLNYSNSPVKSGIYGALIVLDGYNAGEGKGVLQFIVDHGTANIYFRSQTSQGFPHPWRKILVQEL